MEFNCVFTRKVANESYIKVEEAEILSALEDSVTHFIEACHHAELVEILESGFKEAGEVTPKPYIKIVVDCETNPESDLVKRQASMIGDAEYFKEELYPIELLGPKYWVSEDIERSMESIEKDRDETEDSRVDSLITKLFNLVN